MTCHCRISLKIDGSKNLIGIGSKTIVFNPLEIELCGTVICVFVTTKLSSDVSVEIRRLEEIQA